VLNMSVKATRHKRNTSAKEYKQLRKVLDATLEAECPEIAQVCEVMNFADALSKEGWKVKVAPFEDLPILHVRSTKKSRGKKLC
jgi:uncharacterized protein YvpB